MWDASSPHGKAGPSRRARGILRARDNARRLGKAGRDERRLTTSATRSTRDRRGALCASHRGRAKRSSPIDRKSTRLNSSHVEISYAVFCLKKKKQTQKH